MKTTVSIYDFRDGFQALRPDNFSYDGLTALFEYKENWEFELGEEVELDVIAFCCEYTEYENIAEYNAEYNEKVETIEDIREQTTVINIDDVRFIIQNY